MNGLASSLSGWLALAFGVYWLILAAGDDEPCFTPTLLSHQPCVGRRSLGIYRTWIDEAPGATRVATTRAAGPRADP